MRFDGSAAKPTEGQRAWTGVCAVELRRNECIWSDEARPAHLDFTASSDGKNMVFAADSLQHRSMTLQARDGPATLMGSSGAQMGFTLAPRDFKLLA